MQPAANSTWFNFTVQGGTFSVYAFSGREEVSRPFEFVIELVSLSAQEDVTGLLGKPGCLSILDRTGTPRLVHGLVREMRQLHTGNLFTHYQCLLKPRFDFLKDTCNHRIFQKKSVPDIITQILQEQGFSGDGFAFKCKGPFEPREYCVQYGESDFHFISRLCEEEGIYYYFEHSQSGHCLCFSNMAGGPPIPGESSLRFFPGSGQNASTAVIARLNLHGRTVSDTATYREWNFEQPKLDLTGTMNETDAQKAPVPPGMKLETYRYPHIYQEKAQAQRYAEIQLLRQTSFAKWIEGQGDVSRFTPGYSFTVTQHNRSDLNAQWWVTAVEHFGEQPGVLEHEAPDRGLQYNAHFTAIPAMTRFVPPLRHPKVRIPGDQTAIVTGPEGEEIYPDKYGRVKVQFFWDRLDQWNEKSTCWIRVAQGWAGPKYGTMAIPRIGHEVIVTFLEGDPDRPIITGRVYHALNMPPYELPDNKTRTVFKSMSTPGEENEERGFNEFRIEDKKDEEEIYLHAQKDVNIHVRNDWKEHILHDRHQTVNNFSYTWIKGEEHLIVEKPRKVELLAEDHLKVKGDAHSEYESKWLVKTGQEIHFAAGDKVVIEAGSDLTIKGGGAFIRLTPAGVNISGGKVSINEGGSPGSGSGASPEAPVEATGVDATGKPIAPEQRKGEEVIAAAGMNTQAISNSIIAFDFEEMPTDKWWGTDPWQNCIEDPKILEQSSAYRGYREACDPANRPSANDAGWEDDLKSVKTPTEFQEKLQAANSAANERLKDKNYIDMDDVWKTPKQTLADGKGDCEDIATYKQALLEEAGVPSENMYVATVTAPSGEAHAVLVVIDPATGRAYSLDSKVDDITINITNYTLLAVFSEERLCVPGHKDTGKQ